MIKHFSFARLFWLVLRCNILLYNSIHLSMKLITLKLLRLKLKRIFSFCLENFFIVVINCVYLMILNSTLLFAWSCSALHLLHLFNNWLSPYPLYVNLEAAIPLLLNIGKKILLFFQKVFDCNLLNLYYQYEH